jgi:hypothetical protein
MDGFENVASGSDTRARLLRFVKGAWLAGVERAVVFPGSRAIALALNEGWVRIVRGEAVQRVARQPGEPVLAREELGELDTEMWPLFDGRPSDPWGYTYALLLQFCSDGRRLTFETRSVTGASAVRDLAAAVTWHRRIEGNSAKPIIELNVGTWQSDRGPNPIPRFDIVDWINGNQPAAAANRPVVSSATQSALQQKLGASGQVFPQPRRRSQTEQPAEKKPVSEALDDELPF